MLIATLIECGAELPRIGPLEDLIRASTEIASRFGAVAN